MDTAEKMLALAFAFLLVVLTVGMLFAINIEMRKVAAIEANCATFTTD